jgi:quercetin dioxygenase-like cupin family protein
MDTSEHLTTANRRLALTLGLAGAGSALAASARFAAAQPYRADEGEETKSPGVRRVRVSERASMAMGGRDNVLPGYKSLIVNDFVYQPGAKSGVGDPMPNDMVCQCIEGEMRLDHGHGHAFQAKKGDVWTCVKGQPENVENTGSTVAIMRVINLIPG